MRSYPGPIRDEPLPIALHNTVYAAGGEVVDGLADDPAAWVAAVGLAFALDPQRAGELLALRESVRDALQATAARRALPRSAVAALNEASARSPRSLRLRDGARDERHHGDSPTDALLATIAAATIELVTGPHVADLRSCGAPACVLMFVKDHPRREWCSPACGNRARQARHYARTRAAK